MSRPLHVLACVALPLALLAGCAGKPVAPVVTARNVLPPEFVATHMAVLRCTDLAPVGLQLNDKAVRIDAPHAPRDLPQAVAQDGVDVGAVYEADGYRLAFTDSGAIYTRPGDAAAIDCRVLPVKNAWDSARLRDVTFRAVGQEPGWLLEVVPDKWMLLLANYGQDRVIVPPVAPVKEGDNLRFHTETDKHVIDVLATPLTCSDGMSDETFDTAVKVFLDGVTFNGCGRWLVKP